MLKHNLNFSTLFLFAAVGCVATDAAALTSSTARRTRRTTPTSGERSDALGMDLWMAVMWRGSRELSSRDGATIEI